MLRKTILIDKLLFMENKILVSVILASYNHAAYVEKAVRSVLDQDAGVMELIVVDDGSSDATPDIVARINDPRVSLIRLEENRRFHPRNTGLKQAKGKYVAFQNSDDLWKEGKIKKQLEILENDPGLSACFTGVEIIDKKGAIIKNSRASRIFSGKNRKPAEWLREFFYNGNCLCLASALVRRSCLDRAGFFNPALVQLSDLDLWVRLAAEGGFHVISEKLTCMRVLPGQNLSGPGSFVSDCRIIAEMAEVLERYYRMPITKMLSEIFHSENPLMPVSKTTAAGALALMSWELSAPHVMAANKIMAELVADPVTREELAREFGAGIIQKFYKMRGRVKMTRPRGVFLAAEKIRVAAKALVRSIICGR